MATESLLDSLHSLLSQPLLAATALQLKESPEDIAKAFKASLAGVLAAVTELATRPHGAARLEGLLKTPGVGPELIDGVAAAASGAGKAAQAYHALGATLNQAVFGGTASNVGNAVAATAGLGRASGEALLTLSTPLVLGSLAAHQTRTGLGATYLANELKAQRTSTLAAVPQVLAEAIDVATASEIARSNPIGWFLVPVAFVVGILLLLRGCGSVAPKPPAEPPVVAAPAPAPEAAPAPAPAEVVPPNAKLYFAVDKADKWVDGGESLSVMVAWLQSHPTAKVAISGYHDPSGNREHNQELAKARAIVVRDALVAGGIATERIALEKPVETTGSGDPAEARRVEVSLQP